MGSFKATIETNKLSDLLPDDGGEINIPEYQRPYSWRDEHVEALLADTFMAFQKGKEYLLGTLILHKTEKTGEPLEIVDGQQRLVTLAILLYQLENGEMDKKWQLPKFEFRHIQSKNHVLNTKKLIESFLCRKHDEEKRKYREYLKEKLVFTVLTLGGDNALDQAYAFFDSVNSKGKALTDYDLLKAHHLMFMPQDLESLARAHNDEWQARDEDHPKLFGDILRRIRMWNRGRDRDSRAERNIYYEFVSQVEPERETDETHYFNRYMQPAAFRSWSREGNQVVLHMAYPLSDGESLLPMEVPQTIEGGDAFFLYAKRYHALYAALFKMPEKGGHVSTAVSFVRDLSAHIDNNYLRTAFQAVVLLYYDKFGELHLIDFSVCAERIVSERRKLARSVRVEGLLTHVRDNKLVPTILNAVQPSHVVSVLLDEAAGLQGWGSDLTGAQRRYAERRKQFYDRNISKISAKKIRDIAKPVIEEKMTNV